MVGAITTHLSRHDPAASVVMTSVLFAMSVTVAVVRFRGMGAREPVHAAAVTA